MIDMYVANVAREMTDESNIGIVLWIVLIAGLNIAWISMDIWLRSHNHEMLTEEFREGLKNPWLGPLLAFLTFGTIASFVYHMFFEKNLPRVH